MLKAPLVGAVFIVIISIVLRFYIENVYIKVPVIIIVSAIVYLLTLILMKDGFALKTLKPLIDKLVYNKRGK
jgi:DNA integrity scanning protein DisA with diadenylate cyclase activity